MDLDMDMNMEIEMFELGGRACLTFARWIQVPRDT